MNDKSIVIANAFKHLGTGPHLGEGITSGFTWMSVKNKTWTLHHGKESRLIVREDDGHPLPYLDVIIVGVNPAISKLYYIGSYNEGASAPPDCASTDGIKPNAGVPNRQNPICGTCRHNAWGSASNGSRGKACQDHKRIAVLLMPYMTKKMFGGQAMLDPVFIKIPPDSLNNWKTYGDSLQHRNAHWAAVVTRIGFAPDKLFQLTFTLKQALTDAEAPVVLPMLEDPQTLNILGTGYGSSVASIPAIPEEPKPEPEIMETGLLEAFGTEPAAPAAPAPAPRRGRPPGSTNKPKPPPVEAAVDPAPEPAATASEGNGEDTDYDADAGLDDRVKNLLQSKTGKMLT